MIKKLLLSFSILLLLSSLSAQQLSDRAWARADSLLGQMTLDEKVGQMTLFTSDWVVTGPTLRPGYRDDILAGKVGAIFNAHTSEYNHQLQKMAVEETRLGIPLLFGYDVVHGYRTIFPIPLGESASWDLQGIEQTARIAAVEASAAGLNWTFAPMVDIARDPRWGRVAEGAGEDTYLGSLISAARVRGFQGQNIGDENTILACVKHYAAYGAAQAGRDYNTVDISDRTLREIYLPPFKAAKDAGVYSFMTAFNDVDAVPCSGNSYLLQDILRKEWGFQGMVVTDYTSINEMVPHGIVANNAEAATLAVNAGVDMDMQGAVYYDYLAKQVKEGLVSVETVDQSVRYILALKYELGLFDDPYRYGSKEREAEEVFSQAHLNVALESSIKSLVLLKNERGALPISASKSIAVVGPLADNKAEMLGNWFGDGRADDVITPLMAFRAIGADVYYAKGCETSGEDESRISEAVVAAEQADIIVAFVGESGYMSGEAASRSDITLPGPQRALISALEATGKPLVLVLMNGRPLDLSWEVAHCDAILEAWFPGTMGGPAIVEVLMGEANPSGRLPITFPRSVGQVPIFYNAKNTGRPFDANNKYTSKYLDVENTPLFPFGFGLSYAEITYGKPVLSKTEFSASETVKISIRVTNTGDVATTETVQLYVHDLVGSVTRPLKELKGFQQVTLAPGATQQVEFEIGVNDLAFYTRDMTWKAEPGDFEIQLGPNSRDVQTATIKLTD
ncbi:MAG: glycoside hydrolase family 3 C-terminal domain-containing protein [Bacteroidia bacterium]|nr:glycoside hydrolase family 3 C-terminal domain-containing protein [Bacteroidia bacterium]